MDAIKKVLAPGKSKDDEIMYGDRSNAGVSDSGKGQYSQGVPQGQDAPTLHTLPESEKKDHGILRQIFNPSGDKYDEQKYSSTATTDPSAAPHQTTGDKTASTGGTNIKDDESALSIKSGVLGPYANNSTPADPASATTASSTTATQPSHGATGPSSTVPTTGTSTTDYGSRTAPASTAAYTQGSSSTTNTSTSPTDTRSNPSHLERDAAIGGAGAGAGALAYGATRDRQHHDSKPVGAAVSDPTDAERSFPLSGGAAATSHETRPPPSATSSNYSQPTGDVPQDLTSRGTDTTYGRSTDATPFTASSTTTTAGQSSHRGAETAALGGAAALGAGSVAAHEHNKHNQQPQTTGQYSSSTTSQGLSHHVHNDGSAHTTGADGHEHRFAPAAGALGGATALGAGSAAAHEQQKQNSGLAYHDPSATEGGLSHHVYNGVAGKPRSADHEGSAATGAGAATSTLPLRNTASSATANTGSPAVGQHHDSGLASAGLASSTGPSHGTIDSTSAPTGSSGLGQRHDTGHPSAGVALSTATPRGANDSTTTSTGSPALGHHHNAGIESEGAGAAALGAAGLSKHEADKHDSQHIPGEFPSDQPTQSLDRSGFGTSSSAGAAGIAAQEASRRHGGPSTTSAATTSSSPSDVRGLANQEVGQTPHASQQGSDHHYGRDAAVVGGLGAAGAGAYGASKHHDHKDPTSTGTTSATTGEPQQKSSLLSKLDPRHKSDSSAADEKVEKKEHHPARDTAIAGGVGAGAYEAQKHHSHKDHSSTTESSTEPHQKQSIFDKLNPLKKSDSAAAEEKAEKKEHHPARDTAIAGGVGAGAYEAQKHHGHKDHSSTTDSSTEPHQKQSLLDKLNPSKKSESGHAKKDDVPKTHTAQHTSVFGGVGAAGLGGYEYEKHEDAEKLPSGPSGSASASAPHSSATGPASNTIGPHDSNVANVVDPRVQPQPQYQKEHTTTGPHQSDTLNRLDPQSDPSKTSAQDKHHYGRDAAIAGGAAGTAGGVAAYATPKQPSASGPASNTVGPHESNIVNILDPKVKPQPEYQKKQNTVGPHQSDTLNKLDPRVTADPAKAQAQNKEQHDPRNAAVAGAGVAGAGTAAYGAHEHEKRHEDKYQEPKQHDNKHHEEKHHDSKHHESKHHHEPSVQEDAHGHNKLHKDPPAEKKEGFLHKLLHPGKKDKHDESEVSSSQSAVTGQQGAGTVTDPHTGLPVNVDKYGSGAGGTDGAQQIEGFHQHGEGQAGAHNPDWQEIKKANTPY